tara:strand:+ start:323 stop:640 length:318 start_codon:yes stop_codon:yes gene_type:complete
MPYQKPHLVDYNLINFPKKQITKIQKKISNSDHTKLYINIFMVLILFLGLYLLYYRMKTKINTIEENNANLLFINEYINHSLGELYDQEDKPTLDQNIPAEKYYN